MALLALPPLDLSFSGDPLVICSFTCISRLVEPAGRSFHEYAKLRVTVNTDNQQKKKKNKKKNDSNDSSDEESENYDNVKAKKQQEEWDRKKKAPGEHNRLKKCLDGENLYKLLEIDEGATLEEIKKAYRKMVLVYHPDKNKSASLGTFDDTTTNMSDTERHQRFLAIQDAWEILSDMGLRRIYDSSIPFDETIPDGNRQYTEEEFYIIFTEVFNRNSRWSIKRPVPLLGNKNSTPKELKKFYEFWTYFQSWRDFSIHNEYDINEAECRDEKRWYEKQNKKIREKYEKGERERIRNLVDIANKNDPRIKLIKEEERRVFEEEKLKKMMEIERKKKEIEDEKIRVELERIEKEKLELELKMKEKEIKDFNRNKSKFCRQQIRKIHSIILIILQKKNNNKINIISSEILQEMTLELDVLDLHQFLMKLINIIDHTCIDYIEDKILDIIVNKINKEMTYEKVEHLIEIYVNVEKEFFEKKNSIEQEKKKKLLEEKMRMEEKKRLEEEKKKIKNNDWTFDDLALLSKGLQKFPGGALNRWQLIAELFQGRKTVDEVTHKAKEISTGVNLKALSGNYAQKAFEQFVHNNPNALKKIDAAGDVNYEEKHIEITVEKIVEKKEENIWTKEQQTALEKALVKYPASLPVNERWTSIANEVEGKTKKECAARFKEIKEAIAKKK